MMIPETQRIGRYSEATDGGNQALRRLRKYGDFILKLRVSWKRSPSGITMMFHAVRLRATEQEQPHQGPLCKLTI